MKTERVQVKSLELGDRIVLPTGAIVEVQSHEGARVIVSKEGGSGTFSLLVYSPTNEDLLMRCERIIHE